MKADEIVAFGDRLKACPICHSNVAYWKEKVNRSIPYSIDLCPSCGYAFVNPRPTLDFLMDFYASSGHEPGHGATEKEYQTSTDVVENEKKFPNSTLDAKRIIKKINALHSPQLNKSFLDIGCGYGFFSLEAKNAGFAISMLELADNERKIAQDLTGVEPRASSFEEYDSNGAKFSAILMSQILEHAHDVDLWIKKAHSLLETDGILCIAVPNFGSLFRKIMQEKEPYITPPTHLNFFSKRNLEKLLADHGFEVKGFEYVSRIADTKLKQRIPKPFKPISPLASLATGAGFGVIDGLGLGMIIRVFARKK